MKTSHTLKLRVRAAVLYGVVFALFLLFFLYMLCCEQASVYQPRKVHTITEVTDYETELVQDPQAPAGIRKLYRWTIDSRYCDGDSLCFYLVHHFAQVYLDGELVYSLELPDNNLIGKSASSNWVTIPIYPEDIGVEVMVVVTPAYRQVLDRTPRFLMGSQFRIFYDTLMSDADIMLFSLICILTGLFIMSMQGYMLIKRRPPSSQMFYLGAFAVTLGFWRVTDTRMIAFLLPDKAMALGYITIGALLLSIIPLLLFMKERMTDFDRAPLLHAAMVVSVVALLVLLLQVIGVADLRQMLVISHMLIVAASVMVVVSVAVRNIRTRTPVSRRSVVLVGILAVGVTLDIVRFYWEKKSENVLYTALAFVIYMVCLFTIDIYETKTKAYTDPCTGLFNKNRWDELMEQQIPTAGDVGVMMLDLNGLKAVNDTLGHQAGDRMIFHFANILRNTLPPGSVICRWGGDEFAVMLMDTSEEMMGKYRADLQRAADVYNASAVPPLIHFACGYVLSSEFPELERWELLGRADERMYADKRAWYDLKGRGT